MQIYCPNCNAGYEIDEALIKGQSRRLRCSRCGEVFFADVLNQEAKENNPENPFEALSAAMTEDDAHVPAEENIREETAEEDASGAEEKTEADTETEENVEEQQRPHDETEADDAAAEQEKDENAELPETNGEEESADNVDLEKIFERLSEHTEHLIDQEKKLPLYEKIWLQIKNALGFHFKIRWIYIVAGAAFFVLLSLYNNRYHLVREMPFLNSAYKMLGIKAKIPGEGLEFQNIGWDFVRDDEGARLEIKGFIYNQTDKEIEIPRIHVEILDKEIALQQSSNRDIEEQKLEAHAKIPLNLVIKNPARSAKYVYLTFIDKD